MTRSMAVALVCPLLSSACQSYDFSPVKPNSVAVQDNTMTVDVHPLAPNIMLVVDRSGSMTDSADGNHVGACDNGSGYAGRTDTGSCKWNDLLDVLIGPAGTTGQGFLAELDDAFSTNAANNDPLPLGLTELPGPPPPNAGSIASSCSTGSGSILAPVLATNEASVTTALLKIAPGGGTPTAATMSLVQGAFPASDPSVSTQRANYVILMTDGAPNCDSNFPASAANCTDDRCTLTTPTSSCTTAAWGSPSCACSFGGAVVPEGCLDEDGTVAAIKAMYDGGITTFVIGFGASTVSPSSTETLQRMGAAGQGLATASPTSYYQANDAASLTAALNAIIGAIVKNPCVFNLEPAPPSQDLIEVLLTPRNRSTVTLTSTDFSFDAGAKQLTVKDGAACTLIKNSTATSPVQVEIKYLLEE